MYNFKRVIFKPVLAVAALSLSAAFGQNLDSSGNGMLKGTFYFRLLQASNVDPTYGDVSEVVGVSGTMTFDGAGNYTVNANAVDSVSGTSTVTSPGTYTIGANGFGFIANPLTPSDSSEVLYGGFGQGIFVGSGTEGSVNNTFIAIPAGAAPTNASFTASYWAGLIDFPGGTSASLKNALFELSPNGSGTFGTITLNGQAENQTNPTITQTTTGATYTFPGNGSISLNVPTPSGISATNALFSGSKTMYVSADGNFVLGFTPNGYDLIFGTKAMSATAGNSLFQGLYYTSAFEDFPADQGGGCGDVDSYYGSLTSDGKGDQIVHQRLVGAFCSAFDFETDDYVTFAPPNGNASDTNGYNYAFGDGGQAYVAIGSGGFFSLQAGVHANTFSGTGVFLNPIGVTNAASFAPITASVVPGELVFLVGSGLASGTQITQGGIPFPTTLGGVQVLVNGTPAPIYYVSQTQVAAILPYEISSSIIASIVVSNGGQQSQPVTLFTNDAMPGIFSQTANGIGYAVAVHTSTGQLVTPSNPAMAGEYLAVFLTGLGTVTPTITDGAVGPSNPPSYADLFNDGLLGVFFDDYTNQTFPQANVTFAGLVPTLAGLYQMNVQVPTGFGAGDLVYIEVATDDADVNQIQIPVGSATISSAQPQERSGVIHMHGRPMAPRKHDRKASAGTKRNPVISTVAR